jgi:hypothetical protein
MEDAMIDRRRTSTTALALGLGLAAASAAWAGPAETAERDQAVMQRPRAADHVAALERRLPEHLRVRLSSAARNLAHLSQIWDQVQAGAGGGPRPLVPSPAVLTGVLPAGRISDPAQDALNSLTSSRLGGFTQNETSTAWCSPNVVVGFNDSGSFLATVTNPRTAPTSFNGVSRSITNGSTFKDLGLLNPSANPDIDLAGDPVLGCTDANTFYYASLLIDNGPPNTAVSVSKSTDGGVTFADPVQAIAKPLANHFLDKEWMAVDPANPNNIYVTYTDFDSSFPNACSSTTSIFRNAIELVRSTDAGATWSAPVVIEEGCTGLNLNAGSLGSQVALGPLGEVYVAYEHFAGTLVFPTAAFPEIDIVKSTDGGATFGQLRKVASVNSSGLTIDALGFSLGLQGNIRTNEFPTLAVDRSTKPSKGNVYLSWNDPHRGVAETFLNLGLVGVPLGYVYNYSDISFAKSTDGGKSFSFRPIQVNNNSDAGLNEFTDQFMPGMAVDKNGKVGICFYDRRKDLQNFLIDRECATSTTTGDLWVNVKKTTKPFPSVSDQDLLLANGYMGDYDGLTSDNRNISVGFVGAYGDNTLGNPDVKVNKQ